MSILLVQLYDGRQAVETALALCRFCTLDVLVPFVRDEVDWISEGLVAWLAECAGRPRWPAWWQHGRIGADQLGQAWNMCVGRRIAIARERRSARGGQVKSDGFGERQRRRRS